MIELGKKNPNQSLTDWGIRVKKAHWNLKPEELEAIAIENQQATRSSLGAIVVNTGEFTGRSPKDRFIVKDALTENTVDWNPINQAFPKEKFDGLKAKIISYLADKEVFVRDAIAGADPEFQLSLRLVSEFPWSNQFAYNMFIRPTDDQIESAQPQWKILCAPGCKADPQKDGTRQHNFSLIDFTDKTILIGGSAYTGEIKKGIFSVLNYILPIENKVLSMHCSSNMGDDGDTAIFFGLSGTGKTTLSADPSRSLIGDDEHGWSEKGVFNFEGGCYAKTINLSAEKEPQIYNAIREGAIIENVPLNDAGEPDFEDSSITPNTRVSYPIHFIDNSRIPSVGGIPKHIFFLTYDAFGVLPPLSKLNMGQAMYHFISGYTSKVAGTEAGVTEPQTTFSACFGAPFLPLHPTKYAEMLGEKMKKFEVNVWLVNTGMTGGAYGTGKRMSLPHTRALITSVLSGQLVDVEFVTHNIFGVQIPTKCEGVPSEILNPEATWEDKAAYTQSATKLAEAFVNNFEKFADKANDEILTAAPKLSVEA